MRCVLINDTRIDRHHGCDAVIGGSFELAEAAGMKITATAPAHRDWRNDPVFVQALMQSDVVIVNGEGTLHHDARWGEPLLAAGAYARRHGKKAALINTSWQFNGPAYTEMSRSFDLIAVRETLSAAIFEAQGVPCRIVPDLALLHDIPAADSRGGVVYSDSAVPVVSLALAARMHGMAGALPVSIFTHPPEAYQAFRTTRSLAPGFDIFNPVRLQAALRLGYRDAMARQADAKAWKAAVGRRRLIVTGRFHLLAFCLAARTPFLAIGSNTSKVEALVADAGLPMWRTPHIDQIDTALLDRAACWEPGEMEAIENYLVQGRAEMTRLFRDIVALVE